MSNVLKKLGSTKLWLALWAVVMTTFIIVQKMNDFVSLAYMLSGVVLAYIFGNVFQDFIFQGKGRS